MRFKRAKLLGYQTHAHFVLEERMAQSASQVNQFLDDLYQNALPFATKEWEQIERFASEKLDLTDLQKWDTSYVSEKLKQELFDFDDQIIGIEWQLKPKQIQLSPKDAIQPLFKDAEYFDNKINLYV